MRRPGSQGSGVRGQKSGQPPPCRPPRPFAVGESAPPPSTGLAPVCIRLNLPSRRAPAPPAGLLPPAGRLSAVIPSLPRDLGIIPYPQTCRASGADVAVRKRILKNEGVPLLLSAVRPETAGWWQEIPFGFRPVSCFPHVRRPHSTLNGSPSAGRGYRTFLLGFGGIPRENNPRILRRCRFLFPHPARCPQDVAVRKRILKNEGLQRQNKRLDFAKMARCGRPELDSCPRGVVLDAPGRKRHAFVLPPRFLKSFSACSSHTSDPIPAP